MRHASSSRLREAGITIVEVIVVISVIGIVVGVSVGRLRGAYAQQEMDGWVRAMTKEVTGARHTAIARREQVNVQVTTTSYTITTAGGMTLFTSTAPAGVTLWTDCPANTCSFNRRGLPVLGAVGNISVTSVTAGRGYTVQIETGTGRVFQSAPSPYP